jgi:hypothetical protein
MRREGGCTAGAAAVSFGSTLEAGVALTDGLSAVGFIALALVVCLARGPRETGWVGWSGGWAIRRDDLRAKGGSDIETVAEGGLVETSSVGVDGTKSQEK